MFRHSLPAQCLGGAYLYAQILKKSSTARVLHQQLLIH
jgi:hypothetical protein